jgi:DNA-directed RNA polymerase specialized sigma24 family protein
MTTQTVTSESLWTTFVTAVLLTGSLKRAETAMIEGIRLLDVEVDPIEELHRTTVSAAIDPHDRPQAPEEIAQASLRLPVELQRVLRLPLDLRRSFVLRLLVGLPRESCARLLGLDTGDIDRATCLAARALAQMVQGEKKNA